MRTKLTEKKFLEKLERNTTAGIALQVVSLMNELRSLGLLLHLGSRDASFRFKDPRDPSCLYSILLITSTGHFYVDWLDKPAAKGYEPSVALDYLKGLCKAVGGTQKGVATMAWRPLKALLSAKTQVRSLIDDYLKRLASAP